MATFTYDLSTQIGKLRLEILDTDSNSYIYSDEELQYFLNKANNNLMWAVVYVCENRCSIDGVNAGKQIDVGNIKIKGSDNAGINWCNRAKELRDLLSSGLTPESFDSFSVYSYVSGVYKADRDKFNEDIKNGILIERDFYDYYNESTPRGGLLSEADDEIDD